MAVAFPNYPAGPQFLADTLWAETLYQTRRLQSSLYGNDDTFYSTGDDKADPKVVDEFRTLTRQARLLTEARLKQYPKDMEALYFLGAIEGLKASFEEAVERRHFAALKDGSDAVDKHREVIKLDPTIVTLKLRLVCTTIRWARCLCRSSSSRACLAFAARRSADWRRSSAWPKKGSWVHDEAKTLLIVLYTREKRFAEAAAYCARAGGEISAQLSLSTGSGRRAGFASSAWSARQTIPRR